MHSSENGKFSKNEECLPRGKEEFPPGEFFCVHESELKGLATATQSMATD